MKDGQISQLLLQTGQLPQKTILAFQAAVSLRRRLVQVAGGERIEIIVRRHFAGQIMVCIQQSACQHERNERQSKAPGGQSRGGAFFRSSPATASTAASPAAPTPNGRPRRSTVISPAASEPLR